jgi:translation initiation factor 1
VAIKGQEATLSAKEKKVEKLNGKLNIRVEKKGRAGKPVAILCGFSDPQARNPENLKQLCSDLKNKLACGGTVEENEIVLMTRDMDRLTKVLLESFGLDARRK